MQLPYVYYESTTKCSLYYIYYMLHVHIRDIILLVEDDTTRLHQEDSEHHHHEQHPEVQATFINYIRTLLSVVEEMGSPFPEESKDLLVLDTRYIMNVTVWETVRSVEVLSEEQYNN